MKIIFVCTGNTCRSPMAEGYLKAMNIPSLEVQSRGLTFGGEAVSRNSAAVMEEIGIDIHSHISSPLSRDDMNADFFIPMTSEHERVLISAGIGKDKIIPMPKSVPDPFGGDETVYRACRDAITDGIDTLVFGGAFLPYTAEEIKYEDISSVAALEKECFSAPWSENAIAESVSSGTHFCAAKENGRLIGYAGVSFVCDEGYITNIAVTEKSRNKGVGTLLINYLLSLARKNAAAFISLEVRESNTQAQALYEKLGFSVKGRRKDFYDFPKEDALIMTRRFKV